MTAFKALIAAILLFPTIAFGQSAVSQAGPPAAGHASMYLNSTGGQVFVQDSGAARGGKSGTGLSELLLMARGTGNPPFAGQGTGPYGANFCDYDGPTTNATGYHYFCMSPNADGGGLLAFGYAGGASPLPLQFVVNGTTYQFPFSISGVLGPPSTTVNDLACWNNTSGTLLKDCGAPVNLLATANTWLLTQTFDVTPVIPGLPNLTTDVEGTGIPGLDDANWFIYQAPTTVAQAVNPTLRVQRSADYTNNIAITGASGTGTTATFTYVGAAIPLGDTIYISGEQPIGYNGSCVVTASAANSVSCANATTGAQTVAGMFYDQSAIGVVNTIWAANFTAPTASEYEWDILGQQYAQTGIILGNNAQSVAVDGTVFKQFESGGNYQTAAFTGSTNLTTLTVTAVASGSLNSSNVLTGATNSFIAGTYIVSQLTSTETGGALHGRGTYQISQSQTLASQTVTATDQLGYAAGGNFVCNDQTGTIEPSGPCVGVEIDNYWKPGVGTDPNQQRVVLQLAWGGDPTPSTSADHIATGILFGGQDAATMDVAIRLESYLGGAYGTVLDTTGATVTNFVINATGATLDGAGNFVAASYAAGTSVGLSCSGSPTSSFASVNGIVTHC